MSRPGSHATALSLLHRGLFAEAESTLRGLLQQVHLRDEEYDLWLASLVETLRAGGRQREAGSVLLYLSRFSEAHDAFVAAGARGDAARTRQLWAQAAPSEAASSLYLGAARELEDLQLSVEAAIAYTAAGAHGEAVRSWERVVRDPRLARRPYEQALAAYNLGMSSRRAGRHEGAERQLARAQRLLEEVADDFESNGERERAFDCYAILLHHGRELGSFENLAEGYVNCIRVLQEDNLKFYALQYYEDFIRLALERDEFHAAAGACKEAADYARRIRLPYERVYQRRCGESWWRAAEKNEQIGGPVDLSENAYLASVDAWAALGDFQLVSATYERLARLGLAEPRRARYRRIATRYQGADDQPAGRDAVPDHLRRQHIYPPIWEQDLVEWEIDGDPLAVCALIAGQRPRAGGKGARSGQPAIIRRRALLVLLDLVRAGHVDEPGRLASIAQSLGELQSYAALRPLEKLYGSPDAGVRRGVMRALRKLYFKRTFQLIRRGLADEDAGVRAAALEAVDGLHFPHAFDPLQRIFRDVADPAIKARALRSIARINNVEAGEFLIEVLRHEPEPMRDVARRELASLDNADVLEILERHLEVESGPARNDLEQILRRA